ncbi:MAG: LytTR family DNA-binding domain-containing protein [Bacteroidota bacterium]
MNSIPKNVKILVADDEALARKRIVKFLTESDVTSTVIEATTGKESVIALNVENPDLVFLDIKMTDMTGFEVLREVPPEKIPVVIFVTAFDTFAIKAFELRAIDFLLKPYKKERFFKALSRGIEQLELTKRRSFQDKVSHLMDIFLAEKWETDSSPKYLDQLVLKLNKRYYFIKTSQMKYIRSSAYYVEIFTVDKKKHLYRISMTELILKLDPEKFSRINRSTIISKDHIRELVSEGMGDFSVIMNDGSSFTVTKHYKSSFLEKMGIR